MFENTFILENIFWVHFSVYIYDNDENMKIIFNLTINNCLDSVFKDIPVNGHHF